MSSASVTARCCQLRSSGLTYDGKRNSLKYPLAEGVGNDREKPWMGKCKEMVRAEDTGHICNL